MSSSTTMRCLARAVTLLPLALSAVNGQAAPAGTTIERDVAIIGGGSAGSYAAIRLRNETSGFGLSVVVIEKEFELGGHVNTWIDPATGRGFDFGVQNFVDLPGAKDYFDTIGVPMQTNVRSTNANRNVDFNTGLEVTNYIAPAAADRTAALQRFVAAVEQYESILEPGYWNFPKPADIPKDLLIPFGEFITKYNITAAVPQIWSTTGFGTHALLEQPTLWILRSFSLAMARTLLGINSALVPVSRKNQDIYIAARAKIGEENILFNNTVVSTVRPAEGSNERVVITTRNSVTGAITTILAKKLLITMAPTTANMAPLDLGLKEQNLFSKFNWSASHVSIVSHPSLPLNTTIVNTPASAAPDNYAAAVPAAPYNTRFENYPDSKYYRAIATGDQTFTAEQAQAAIKESFKKMVAAGTIASDAGQELKFEAFTPHGLVSAVTSNQLLMCGFIDRMMGLQGKRSTWYTGASFGVHISTSMWLEVEEMMPKLAASIAA